MIFTPIFTPNLIILIYRTGSTNRRCYGYVVFNDGRVRLS